VAWEPLSRDQVLLHAVIPWLIYCVVCKVVLQPAVLVYSLTQCISECIDWAMPSRNCRQNIRFSEECDVAEGKGSARRAAEQTVEGKDFGPPDFRIMTVITRPRINVAPSALRAQPSRRNRLPCRSSLHRPCPQKPLQHLLGTLPAPPLRSPAPCHHALAD
jgi:hypothetical protein